MVRSPTATSNDAFDVHLRSLDPAMGLRDAQEVSMQALSLGLEALADEAMPAINRHPGLSEAGGGGGLRYGSVVWAQPWG